jgi:phosphoribosylglycinamide formyltransferase-1
MREKHIGIFASGRGSNFRAILNKCNEGFIPAVVKLLITDNPNAGAIDIASENNIPYRILSPKNFPDGKTFNDSILEELLNAKIEYIVLAGYLKLVGSQIISHYANKIINIHPALLPSFGGKGMYGHHVHQAVYDRGVKISGASVHLVNEKFDAGPIVLQRCIEIEDVKSPAEIAKRVLAIEHEIFPQAVKLVIENKLVIDNLRVRILGEE